MLPAAASFQKKQLGLLLSVAFLQSPLRLLVIVQVALVPGILEKACPHSSTGRADYFGSTVNRAARLLLAAKPGQILAEAPVMDTVLQVWAGHAALMVPGGVRSQAAAVPCSDPTVIPADQPEDPSGLRSLSSKSAPNLLWRLH